MTSMWCRFRTKNVNMLSKTLSSQFKLTSQGRLFQLMKTRHSSSKEIDPHKRSFPREAKPDYDFSGDGPVTADTEYIIPPPEDTYNYTDFEIMKNPEVWKNVERLLPKKIIPEIPEHTSYPTPSGWIPPKEESLNLPYAVKRNKFHHLPLYLEVFDGGNRRMTCIDNVHGDIWAFEEELRTHLEEKLRRKIFTQVDEVCTKVRVKGTFMRDVSNFLLEKGQ